MTVDIHINARNAEEARAEMRALLGDDFDGGVKLRVGQSIASSSVFGFVEKLNETDTALRSDGEQTAEPDAPAAEEPKKRTRRTKAEIEAEKAAQTPAEPAQISTGGERVGPEDDAATAAQDAADEAAEVEASRDPEKPLTTEDLRAIGTEYVQTYGPAAGQADLPEIFEKLLGPIPAGTTNAAGKVLSRWGVSAVPTDQATLAKAVAAVADAVKNNPFGREKV